MNHSLISVEGISKTFKLSKKQQKLTKVDSKYLKAVDNLSFNAYEGEIFGLLGPNGAGKTTALRILSTLIKPDSGDALVDGYSIITQPEEVRSKIGFLTGELKLEDFFTPNYLFDFFSSVHNISSSVREQRKEILFSRFGIDGFREVKVANLSSGMKQKTSLAVSLVHDPNIIIFDEPTNGLDVLTAKVVTDFLLELKESGKTIIISTHIFSLVERICDRVGILIDGQMEVCDRLERLTGKLSLEDLFFLLYQERKGENI
ncbi:MAG: ATP-binding cassette domain-containing protein [Oscillospiraceae bacterium]|nr:ATP-binding cassette domain-containing protein [Oscillospiraceae bacterium]